jgi:hypothetical protein
MIIASGGMRPDIMRPMQRTVFGIGGWQPEAKALILYDPGSEMSLIRNDFARMQGFPREEISPPIVVDSIGGRQLVKYCYSAQLEAGPEALALGDWRYLYGVDEIVKGYRDALIIPDSARELLQHAGYEGKLPTCQPGGRVDVLIGLDLNKYLPREVFRVEPLILYESAWGESPMLAGQAPVPERVRYVRSQGTEAASVVAMIKQKVTAVIKSAPHSRECIRDMARPVVMYNPDIDTDIDMESGLEDERWTAAFREHLRAREEPSAPPMEPPEEEPEQGEAKEDDPERTVATEDGEGARAEAMEACPQVASCNLSRVYFQAEDPVRTSDIEDLLESDEEEARISTSELLASNSKDEWTRPRGD